MKQSRRKHGRAFKAIEHVSLGIAQIKLIPPTM